MALVALLCLCVSGTALAEQRVLVGVVQLVQGHLQENLADSLLHQGRATPGEAGVELLKQAVDAALLAVSAFTCNCLEEKDPQQAAQSRFLLSMTMLEWLERSKPSTELVLRLTPEIEELLRAALSTTTREEDPGFWANIHHHLGIAARLQGEHTQGEARLPLLSRAMEESCLALSQVSREEAERHPAWKNVEQTLREQAKDVSWENPGKPAPFEVQARSEEAYLLSLTFDANRGHIVRPLDHETPQLQVGLRTLNIALFLLYEEGEYVPQELDALRAVIAAQPPDFKARWDFSVLRCFIQNESGLDGSREWLRTLLQAVQAQNRDAMFDGLYRARMSFHAEPRRGASHGAH
jgi:hypothetical protein